MTDLLDAKAELAALDEKLRSTGLSPDEQARCDELRRRCAEDPAAPSPSGFEGWGAAPAGGEPAPDAPFHSESPPEESTGVLWERGPVEAPPPLPPPDPAFDAVVVEVPEEDAVLEVSPEDVEVDLPVEVAEVSAVSWVDEEAPAGEVVSLDALLVTPPPVHAESLAPPLPPPGPTPPPIPHRASAEAPLPGGDPFAPSPSFVSGEHRVVLHTVAGQVLRGSIANADLQDAELPLIQPNGAVARVPAGHVKAIFFMLPAGVQPPQAVGTRVKVTFGDGRQVSGLAPDYSAESVGFFVLPVDTRTHTARVWVYRTAIRQISVG